MNESNWSRRELAAFAVGAAMSRSATAAANFNGPVSFEAWILPAEGESGRILDKLTPGVDDGFLLDAWPQQSLRVIVGPQKCQFPHVLKPGVWQHVTVVLGRGLPQVFLDGRPQASGK